jgi:hypothetical protein
MVLVVDNGYVVDCRFHVSKGSRELLSRRNVRACAEVDRFYYYNISGIQNWFIYVIIRADYQCWYL